MVKKSSSRRRSNHRRNATGRAGRRHGSPSTTLMKSKDVASPDDSPETIDTDAVAAEMQELEDRLRGLQKTAATRVSRIIRKHAGKLFETLRDGQQFAKSINRQLKTFSLEVVDPDTGDGGYLRYREVKQNRPARFFQIDCRVDGKRTSRGGSPGVPVVDVRRKHVAGQPEPDPQVA